MDKDVQLNKDFLDSMSSQEKITRTSREELIKRGVVVDILENWTIAHNEMPRLNRGHRQYACRYNKEYQTPTQEALGELLHTAITKYGDMQFLSNGSNARSVPGRRHAHLFDLLK